MKKVATVVLRENITFSKQLVEKFAHLSGDRNPIHIDEVYCRGTRFGRPIAHGMIAGCFLEALLAREYPQWRLEDVKLNFKAPIYVGDEATFTMTIKEISDTASEVSCMLEKATTVCTTITGNLASRT